MINVTKQAGNALASGYVTSVESQGSGQGNALGQDGPVNKGTNQGNALGQDGPVNKGANQGNALGPLQTGRIYLGADEGNARGPLQTGRIYLGADEGNARGPLQTGRIYLGADEGNARGPLQTGRIYLGADEGNARGPLQTGRINLGSNQGNALGGGSENNDYDKLGGKFVRSGSGNALGGGPSAWEESRKSENDSSYNYPDPALAFSFFLQISGLPDIEALFTECSGLKIKRKPHLYKEGGQNDVVQKFVDRTEYDDVKLKRGITSSTHLWDWYLQGLDTNKVIKRNVTIVLFNVERSDSRQIVLKQWNLMNAFPIEWSGPDLKTDASNVAFETITLTYERLTLGG